jgi:hypothetical protein
LTTVTTIGCIVDILERPTDNVAVPISDAETVSTFAELCHRKEQSSQDQDYFPIVESEGSNITTDQISLEAEGLSLPSNAKQVLSDRGNCATFKKRKRGEHVVGCASSDHRLPAYTSLSELFICNVGRRAEISELRGYLSSKALTVVDLEEISHPESRAKSYLLTVPLKDQGIALDPCFWPQNIQCRTFIRPRTGRLAKM